MTTVAEMIAYLQQFHPNDNVVALSRRLEPKPKPEEKDEDRLDKALGGEHEL